MVSRIIRIFLIAALTGVSVWQFWDGNIGNGIFSIILALIVLFTYFKNEWMLDGHVRHEKKQHGKS